tara:strand:+ start:1070 stop:1582 length:513 start_codon:yes stop_codon:yes gene_type:complete
MGSLVHCNEVLGTKKLQCHNNINRGEISEQIFSTKCFTEYGYMVSMPIGTADYDLVVDVDGRLLRVQVKSSIYKSHNSDTIRFTITKGTNGQKNGRGKYPYPEDSIDFFALHFDNKEWYIIPRHATASTQTLCIQEHCKYQQYKDNWEFLDDPTVNISNPLTEMMSNDTV